MKTDPVVNWTRSGVVRATRESGLSAWLAGIEVLLCLLLFPACTLHGRWRLQHATTPASPAGETA